MYLLLIAVLFVLLYSIWYIGYYYKYDRYLKQYPPGVSMLVLVYYSVFYDILKEILNISMESHKKVGRAIKVSSIFEPPAIQISDPKLLESLLGSTSYLTKGVEYRYMERWLGTGLLTSGPTKWKKHRKILTPAFHFQILDQFIDTFNYYSDILVDTLQSRTANDSTDIYPFINLCSLDIICATSMGTHINAQKDGTSEYVQCVKKMSRILMQRALSFFGRVHFIYSLTSNYRAQEETVKILHNYTDSVIALRRKELQKAGNVQEDKVKSDLGIKQRTTFLDTLLKYKLDGGSITDEEIREEVDTFMFEGHDTISSAISFTLYSLANNGDVQQKVIEELSLIFGNDQNRAATMQDLSQMKYLEMVIKESLRLYPSVPFFSRVVEKDTEFNGAFLPKGVTLGVFAYGAHRNPEVYPEPERFDPERFTPENQAKRSPYAYVPFSAGPRNCIGQRFAMLELKAVVSKVLRTFELLPAVPFHKLELVPELILKSNSGVCINLKNRQW